MKIIEQLNLKDIKQTHLELFQRLADAPDHTRSLEKALLILCTPRCGSTLFAEALNSTERLGLCEEWFNYEYFGAWLVVTGREKSEFALTDYINWVVRKSLRDTGVLCIKWHIGQLVAMNEDFKLGIASMEFDHVVYLYRRDKIAQAVSLAKASTSNQFRSYEKQEFDPSVNREKVAGALHNIIKFDSFARDYLWRYVDVECAYEDFQNLDDFSPYNRTLQAFGMTPVHELTAGRLKKQATAHSDEVVRDFRRYVNGETA